MKTVERPWAMTMARTGPYRFARDALTVAARPIGTLLRTSDRANAAFGCSTVVWSAMIAFHEDRKAPSPTPATRAARTIHFTSVVKANTRIDGGKIALPINKRPLRPRRSE